MANLVLKVTVKKNVFFFVEKVTVNNTNIEVLILVGFVKLKSNDFDFKMLLKKVIHFYKILLLKSRVILRKYIKSRVILGIQNYYF